jgi:hypothetical protein
MDGEDDDVAGTSHRLAPVGVLALLAVLMSGLAGFLLVEARSAGLRDDDRAALEAAARQEMVLLNVVGDQQDDTWRNQVRAGVTDPLRSQVDKLLRQTDDLSQQGLTATPTVIEAGVRDQGTDRATVDLFVTVKVERPGKDPGVVPYRWSATMRKIGGSWLMSDVQPVPGALG